MAASDHLDALFILPPKKEVPKPTTEEKARGLDTGVE
jgi:hypothetical protein